MWIYFSAGSFLQEKDRYDTYDTFLYALRDDDQLTEIKGEDLNVVSYPKGYEGSIGGRPLQGNERGWKISLAMTEEFIKKEANFGITEADIFKVKNNELRSSKLVQSVTQNGPAHLAFTTRSIITRGEDSDNYCASDFVFTAVGQLDLLTGHANTYSDRTRLGRTIIRNQGLFDGFRTYGTIHADSEVANNDSGINLKLKPEERERLDEYFSYDIAIPTGSCSDDYVWTSVFSEGSNIGGRHSPLFYVHGSNTANFREINYIPWYNWSSQYFGNPPLDFDSPSNSTRSDYFNLQLPASAMFGQDGSDAAFQLGSSPWTELPKPTTRRLSIRRRH